MKNYKINLNRPPLTEQDLTPTQENFDLLLKNYRALKTPFYQTPRFRYITGAVLVSTLAAVLLFQKLGEADRSSSSLPFIQPPMAEVNIPAQKFLITAGTDSIVTYKTGTTLYIPAQAFTDRNGNTITGKVELYYREFHDIADVFVAGIPMTYDSAGKKYHFETAGMMEIAAFQNGQALLTNPLALIKVQMASANRENRFNTYYLDTTRQAWQYLTQKNMPDPVSDSLPIPMAQRVGPAPQPDTAQLQSALALLHADIHALQQAKPVEPRTPDEHKPRFTIKVDEKEFPEIAIYNNTKFQVEDEHYDPDKAATLWTNVELKRIPQTINYEIIFSNATEQYKVKATPVFDDKDYADARNIYEQKYDEYVSALRQKKLEQAKLMAALEAQAQAVETQIQAAMKAQQERVRAYEAGLAQRDLVFRTFEVQQFGIWNCDCPQSLPIGADVLAHFENKQTGKEIDVQNVYLVEKGKNVMYTYYPEALEHFRYTPDRQNLVWMITRDRKIAVVREEDFKASTNRKGVMVFQATMVDRPFHTVDEVKEFLSI